MTKFALAALTLLIVAGLIAFFFFPLRAFNALMPKDMASARIAADVAYGEGPRRKLDVYAPKDLSNLRRPVIVFIYGGSWASGTREGYGFAGRALAAQGFVTFIPDYRLAPEVYFPGFLQDCAAAVKWVRANAARYGGDPERIVLVGHSAGAYNAAMLALDPQWLGADRKALRGFAGLSGPYDFLPLDGPVPVRTFGKWPRLDETQPIHYAAADAPPMLLLHGGADLTVWPKNSINLDRRLHALGASSRLIVYPGLGHEGMATALSIPFRYRAPVLKDVVDFARAVTAH